jgi:ribose 5-phosphate isomerase B
MKIALASDHAGFVLKEAIAAGFRQDGIEFHDFGCYSLESVDYPDYLYPAALAVAEGRCDRGVLVPGAAYAGAIVANKIGGIRAAAAEDLFSVRLCREHGDANILCLGGATVGAGLAQQLVKTFLETAFLGGKYARRNDKVTEIEHRHGLVSRPSPANDQIQENPEEDALRLVTEKDVEQALHEERKLTVLRSAIITPSARELLESREVRIRYVDES